MQDVHIAAARGRGGDKEKNIPNTLTLEIGGGYSNALTFSSTINLCLYQYY